MGRKVTKGKIYLDTGAILDIEVFDGVLVDDLLVQGMKAEGYRVISGRDVFPVPDRKLKDYLLRIGQVTE